MSSKINLQTCEYACKSSIFQDNQLIFDKNIEERSNEVITRLKKIYLLSKDLVEKNYNNLEILFELKKQLIKAFGENSVYVSALEEKGLNQFITYIYKNGSLPGSEVEEIKKMLPQSA